ncbi:hypothetical protein NXW27_06490 [Phocaeicola dorei]|nr:hypothetical protein [Phocaeicola dorei]
MASSLFLSGWRLISRIGFNRVEMCTLPCRPPWRELDGRFGFHRPFSSRYLSMGILMGA